MGQTIQDAPQMLAYAGDLRRQAKQAPTPDHAAKLQASAQELERNALVQVVGQTAPHIGALLDTFA